MTVDYDVIIIGAGASGLTAALYCARSGLKILVIEENIIGGNANLSYNIENFPGFPKGISGLDLMDFFYQQTKDIGVMILYDLVTFIDINKKNKQVITLDNSYKCHCIIIATGGSPGRTNALNEEKFIGNGISFCTLCDGMETKGKNVLVIGSGDSAIDQSLYLSHFAKHITVSSLNQESIFDSTDIFKINKLIDLDTRFLWNTEVYAFEGKSVLSQVILKSTKDEKMHLIPCDFCFEFIGYKPNSYLLKDNINLDECGYILTNECMETSVPGIYAIGDVRKKVLRQITTAVSDGAIAGYSVARFIRNFNNGSIN